MAYRLGQLAGLEILKIEEELSGLEAKIKEYEAILGDYIWLWKLWPRN